MDRTQQFLDAEEKANELIETLTTLTEEIESYSAAKEELSDVKGKLAELIASLKKSVDDNRTFIKLLKDLDMNEVILRINKLDIKVSEQNENVTDILKKANSIHIKLLKDHLEIQKEENGTTKATIEKNHAQTIKSQQDSMRLMKRAIDYVLIVAVLALIVGIINMIF